MAKATVLIKKFSDDSVVREIPCNGTREAERVERGANINLNHNDYYTEIQYAEEA